MVFFEDTKGGFYLWPEPEKFYLPVCNYLFLLGVMGRSNDNCFMLFPELLSHDTAAVAATPSVLVLTHGSVLEATACAEHIRCVHRIF